MVTGTTFNPASLFALYGASGIYIPNFNFSLLTASGLSPLYLGSTGVTPVTAVTQVNGLALDQSQGAAIGSELISNPGPFTNTTGITAIGSTVGVSGGILTITSVASNAARAEWALSGLVVGSVYQCRVNARPGVGTGQRIQGWTWATVPTTAFSAGFADYTFRLVATATSGVVRLYASAIGVTTGDTLEVASLSVKLIAGNHAYQATSAARGTIQQVGSRYVWRGDGVDDNLLTTFIPATSTTLIVACEFNAISDVVVGANDAANANPFFIICNGSAGVAGALAGGVGTQNQTTIQGGSNIRDIPGVAVLRVNGTTVSLGWKAFAGSFSWVYQAAQAGVPTTTTPLRIGGNNNGGTAGSLLDGDIYSVFAIQAALTDAEIAQVADYFSR